MIMGLIDSGLPPVIPDMVKLEYRQIVGGNALDKPTFGERFKMALAKIGSIFGKIAGAIGPFFGPFGMVGSAAAYGIQRFSDRAISNMQAKRQNDANLDLAASSLQTGNIFAPGFGSPFGDPSGSMPSGGGIEVAPFAKGYEQGIETTLNNKGTATMDAVSGMQGGSAL
jgi:hypothetical protein